MDYNSTTNFSKELYTNLPSGLIAFSHDVSFSTKESWELEASSQQPESLERVSPPAAEITDAVSICGVVLESPCSAWLSTSIADDGSSSCSWHSETLLAMGVRSTRDRLASGDVRPDWKGGWNTLTEYLHTKNWRVIQCCWFLVKRLYFLCQHTPIYLSKPP